MQQSADSFRQLKILHLILVAGLTMFLLISFVVFKGEPASGVSDEDFERVLQAIAAVASVSLLLLGFNIFKKRILRIREMKELAEKRMQMYKMACVVWWAMIEGPGLFAIVGFILSGNYAFFALALFHTVILAVFMPRKENIIVLLNFTSDEVARLEGTA